MSRLKATHESDTRPILGQRHSTLRCPDRTPGYQTPWDVTIRRRVNCLNLIRCSRHRYDIDTTSKRVPPPRAHYRQPDRRKSTRLTAVPRVAYDPHGMPRRYFSFM
ncbi:hypothetical protein EVAR_4352_1 [Eumeta japonica]|uniref:Uncharacterized protein n=1 Tax=Eumeta variegata TaxID=151549 RepID=A0A4C1VD58_EUMVA|nr:hypothetical protein EVAR_4352_1 [Eumeta japonica]